MGRIIPAGGASRRSSWSGFRTCRPPTRPSPPGGFPLLGRVIALDPGHVKRPSSCTLSGRALRRRHRPTDVLGQLAGVVLHPMLGDEVVPLFLPEAAQGSGD